MIGPGLGSIPTRGGAGGTNSDEKDKGTTDVEEEEGGVHAKPHAAQSTPRPSNWEGSDPLTKKTTTRTTKVTSK
jgi:hypothetical protein